tara:strand:+ start:35 stop:796 length:762 start_codon:yes stop_codon:yes gene_type:complete
MKYYYKLTISRLKAMNKILVLLALISIGLIIWIENESLCEEFKKIVVYKILLRLSYSYLSAFLFYILVIFLPKERRQSYLYLGLSNHITSIYNSVYNILLTIEYTGKNEIKWFAELQGNSHKLDLKEVMDISKKIDPTTRPRILGETRFLNWYEYLTSESRLLKQQINRLSKLYVDLNPEIIQKTEMLFLSIDSLDFDGRIPGNKTLEYCCQILTRLYKTTNDLNNTFENKYSKKYHFEFLKRARKWNKSNKS